jgi:hypothetical protein
MSLDINKIIEVAESVYYDPQIGFAERITKPVQRLTDQDDKKYEIHIVLVSNPDEFLL